MTKKEFIRISGRIEKGIASDEEITLFNAWYQSFQGEEVKWSQQDMGDRKKAEIRLLKRIHREIRKQKVADMPRRVAAWKVAAAVILIGTTSAGLYWSLFRNAPVEVPALTVENDILPGGNKAILKLGDGTEIILDHVREGVLAREGRAAIAKTEEGQVRYNVSGMTGANEEVAYNMISTPAGGQYRLVLSDGSRVWLNAASSIRFPTVFSGPSRRVTITGEVYFEVNEVSEGGQSKPFIVESGDQTVEVLGTRFNIKAYANEAAISTTLLTGSVKVARGMREVLIVPGEQVLNFRNDPDKGLVVEEADTEQAIAWKNGLFQFWNTDIEEIMRQLARWYNIEVHYQGAVTRDRFTGFIARDVNISKVLHMLERAGGVRFKIGGNTVTVIKMMSK